MPTEVVVPLAAWAHAMTEIEQKVEQPIVKEGVVIRNSAGGKPEAVILGFIPADQRKFSYNFVFGLCSPIIKIAEKHGGRPYSTGLYFGGKADERFGRGSCEAHARLQAKGRPQGILNPKKVVGNGVTGIR